MVKPEDNPELEVCPEPPEVCPETSTPLNSKDKLKEDKDLPLMM